MAGGLAGTQAKATVGADQARHFTIIPKEFSLGRAKGQARRVKLFPRELSGARVELVSIRRWLAARGLTGQGQGQGSTCSVGLPLMIRTVNGGTPPNRAAVILTIPIYWYRRW